MIEHEPGWATRLMGWYAGPENGEFCTFIGRNESLVEDLAEMLGRFGYSADRQILAAMGRKNATGPSSRVEVPDALREWICREERVLIRRFYGPGTMSKRLYRKSPEITQP